MYTYIYILQYIDIFNRYTYIYIVHIVLLCEIMVSRVDQFHISFISYPFANTVFEIVWLWILHDFASHRIGHIKKNLVHIVVVQDH